MLVTLLSKSISHPNLYGRQGSLRAVLKRFVQANLVLSTRIEPPVVETSHAYTRYRDAGKALLARKPRTVLDVGAGKKWHFDPELKTTDMQLIGFDIDIAEMDDNPLLDEKVAGDACQSLGVPDGSVDLIMGRAVIEHLHDNLAFLKNAHRSLSDGGHLIVAFPSKFAPFAILNRALPHSTSQWLLANLIPGSKGRLGFETFYDRTSFRAFKQSLVDAGFEVEESYASYYSSYYFRFFTPLFLLSLSLDYLRSAIGNPQFASYFMFVARKGTAVSISTPS